MDASRIDIQDLKERVARMERILEGDAERNLPGLAFSVMTLRSDMKEMKQAVSEFSEVLMSLKLERAKIIGGALVIWTLGGIIGALMLNILKH